VTVIKDEKHQRELVMRLKRIEGQLRGIQAMIEKRADCEQVTQQLSAARRALDKAFFQVVACAVEGGGQREAAALLAKFG
jgi:CsoR family transcriptional regulator, copper-sensing transcriptional repressor